jgi:hypothetical protein
MVRKERRRKSSKAPKRNFYVPHPDRPFKGATKILPDLAFSCVAFTPYRVRATTRLTRNGEWMTAFAVVIGRVARAAKNFFRLREPIRLRIAR